MKLFDNIKPQLQNLSAARLLAQKSSLIIASTAAARSSSGTDLTFFLYRTTKERARKTFPPQQLSNLAHIWRKVGWGIWVTLEEWKILKWRCDLWVFLTLGVKRNSLWKKRTMESEPQGWIQSELKRRMKGGYEHVSLYKYMRFLTYEKEKSTLKNPLYT